MTRKRSVSFTAGAQQDVRDIHRYVRERHGRPAATAFRDRLSAAVARLEDYPYRGTVPHELEAIGITDYRQIVLGVNRIIYCVIGDDAVIVIVADGRRDLQSLLERRLLTG